MREAIRYYDFERKECGPEDAVFVFIETFDDGNRIGSKYGTDDKKYHEELKKALKKKDKTIIKRRK